MQISLQEKLSENPDYLNVYALSFAKSKRVKYSKVSSLISNDFVESDTFVRQHLDDKFKNLSRISKQSKLTRLRSHITKLQNELTISQAIYETMVFTKK
jgi:hypothetical protein